MNDSALPRGSIELGFATKTLKRWRSSLYSSFFALLTVLVVGEPAVAGNNYEIEYLLFTHDTPFIIGTSNHSDTRSLLVEAAMPKTQKRASGVPVQAPLRSVLHQARQALVRSEAHQVVFHGAVVQAPQGAFPPVRHTFSDLKVPTESDLLIDFHLYKPGPLFLKSSLVYRPETTTASVTGFSEKAPPRRSNEKLVIQETRRVRIGEIHYLDHPLLGVLVIVKRRN